MADQEQKQPAKKPRPSKAKSAYALALEKVQGGPTRHPEEQPDTQTANHLNIEPSNQTTSKTVQGDTPIQTANPQNREAENQQTTQTDEQENTQPGKHLASKPGKQQRTKATYYLNMEDIIAIDTLQTKRYRATGKKPEKSELVSEAIQLLSKQENS
jgi:hypothetical protein